jgi:predicted transcriptional regulator
VLKNLHKRNKIESVRRFKPSIDILSRIMKVLLENHSTGKTNLSQRTNVNYVRLSKHLKWLEKRNLVELVVEEDKIVIILTESGRKFALTLTDIS